MRYESEGGTDARVKKSTYDTVEVTDPLSQAAAQTISSKAPVLTSARWVP
ncbi:hypothetical protein [Dickeya zeae]|nr:hypothetical protein [Dickeya zeae]